MKDRSKNLSFFVKEPSATFFIEGISNEHMNSTEKFGQKNCPIYSGNKI